LAENPGSFAERRNIKMLLLAKSYHDFDILDNPQLKNYFPVNGNGHRDHSGQDHADDPPIDPIDQNQSDPPIIQDHSGQARADHSNQEDHAGDPPIDQSDTSVDRADDPLKDPINQDDPNQEDPADSTGETIRKWKPLSEKKRAYLAFKKQYTNIDDLVLSEVMYLSRLQRERTGAFYCNPSHRYIAHQVDCSTKTVERRLANLKKLRLITITHRRPIGNGKWQTSIIKPIRSRVAMLKEDSFMEYFREEQEHPEDNLQKPDAENRQTDVTYIASNLKSSQKKNNKEDKKTMTDTSVRRFDPVFSSNNNQEPEKEKKNGGENKEKAEGQGLEELWQRLLKKYHGYPVVPAWTRKEKDKAKDIENNRYGDEARKLLIYAVRNWGKAKAAYNFLPSLPVWDSLYFHRDKFFALMIEARKAEAKQTEALREREKWLNSADYNGNDKLLGELCKETIKQNGQKEPAQVSVA